MEIIPIESGPVETIGYLAIDNESKEAVIVDTPLESTQAFLSVADEKNARIRAVLFTHSHWDHTADGKEIKQKSGAKVFIHKEDEYRILDPMTHSVLPLPFELEAIKPDEYLNDGDVIDFGNTKLEVLHTPGHTEGGICLVCHSDRVVFTGDTLFRESIGRVDLPGGSMEKISDSIKNKLFSLPDDYTVLCGHGPATTIGHEKNHNPFFYGEAR
jgi:glyoxylase-like metal-dependent hydrolase (beta-lactamase superfamily II)